MLSAKLLLFLGAAQAFPWDGARPTDNLNLNLDVHYVKPPLPTVAPLLRKRQQAGDVTCGWENGQGTSVFYLYCGSGYECATNSLNAFGCCSSQSIDNCGIRTACIDSTSISQRALIYGSDKNALSCTASQLPVCITQLILLKPIATGYLCGSTDDARTETYYSTYWNASSTVIRPTYYNAAYNLYVAPSLISSTQSSTTSPPKTSSSSVAASPTPTPTPAPSDSGSSTPVGAIVGGTVGGVAVIAGLALLAYFLIRRKRQNTNQPPETGGQPFLQQPQSPQTSQYPHSPPQQGYGYPAPSPQSQQYLTNQGVYPEKGAIQNTGPVQGSPETGFSSPTFSNPERMSNVPYQTTHELGG